MSRGGVNDNTTYEKLLGHKSIANVADGTVTGAIGNEALQTNAQNLSGAVNELKKSVSDGKKLLADTITGKGVQTASDATFETIANNIGTLADNLSSASTDSYNRGYSQGVTDADNRANPSSTNYKTGYNAGVSAADNRANTNSANYKSGYNAGALAGKSAGSKSAIWCVNHNSYASLFAIDTNYFTNNGNVIYCREAGTYFIAVSGYYPDLEGKLNINGQVIWHGDITVENNGYTIALPANAYINPYSVKAGTADGADGIIIVKKL